MSPERRRLGGGRRGAPRLLVAVPGLEFGGAERYALAIALAAPSRFQVAAALRPLQAMRPMRRELTAAGVRTLEMVHGRRLRGMIGFATMIELYRPDVVHLTLPWPLSAGELRAACALTSVPTVVVHQLVPRADELRIDERRWRYYRACARRERWVAVSDYGRRMLAQAFELDPSPIPVIHNAPRHRSNGASSGRMQARLALGLAPEDQVVVSVGRLSQEKGHDVLLAAAGQLAPRLPALRVLIAGSGQAREELQRTITAEGLQRQVRLLGQLDDVATLLSAGDVFAFPSRREGTPFAMLEAMSGGLPVVATRFGGAEEIIEPGANGLLVPIDAPEELALALETVLADPVRARAIGELARRSVTRFSETEMVNHTLNVLQAAARGG